jgi:transcriptional regulator with XRE-family HTH domain
MNPPKSGRKDSGSVALGERIAALMKKAGISQREMEKRTKIPQSNISGLITGKQFVSPERMKLIADELEMTPEAVVGDTIPWPRPQHALNFEPKPLPAPDAAFRVASREEADAFDPEDPRPGGEWIASVLGDAKLTLRLQPGLQDYLTAHRGDLTLAESMLLVSFASKPLPDTVKDEAYWDRVLKFLRDEFPGALREARAKSKGDSDAAKGR